MYFYLDRATQNNTDPSILQKKSTAAIPNLWPDLKNQSVFKSRPVEQKFLTCSKYNTLDVNIQLIAGRTVHIWIRPAKHLPFFSSIQTSYSILRSMNGDSSLATRYENGPFGHSNPFADYNRTLIQHLL